MWLLRRDASLGSSVYVLLNDGIMLIRAVHEFTVLESQGVFVKMRAKGEDALPLTRTSGACWRRQRAALTKVSLPHALMPDRVERAANRCARELVQTLSTLVRGKRDEDGVAVRILWCEVLQPEARRGAEPIALEHE